MIAGHPARDERLYRKTPFGLEATSPAGHAVVAVSDSEIINQDVVIVTPSVASTEDVLVDSDSEPEI